MAYDNQLSKYFGFPTHVFPDTDKEKFFRELQQIIIPELESALRLITPDQLDAIKSLGIYDSPTQPEWGTIASLTGYSIPKLGGIRITNNQKYREENKRRISDTFLHELGHLRDRFYNPNAPERNLDIIDMLEKASFSAEYPGYIEGKTTLIPTPLTRMQSDYDNSPTGLNGWIDDVHEQFADLFLWSKKYPKELAERSKTMAELGSAIKMIGPVMALPLLLRTAQAAESGDMPELALSLSNLVPSPVSVDDVYQSLKTGSELDDVLGEAKALMWKQEQERLRDR